MLKYISMWYKIKERINTTWKRKVPKYRCNENRNKKNNYV